MGTINQTWIPTISGVNMNQSFNWLSLTLATACLVGCVSVQADIEDVQITRKNIVMPGAPGDVPAGAASGNSDPQYPIAGSAEDYALPPQHFSYSDALTQLPEGVRTSLTLKYVVVAAPRDLSFLRKIALTVATPDSDAGKPRTLFEYSPNGSDSASNGVLNIPISGPEITIDPTKIHASDYELSTWGRLEDLPREPWAVDVTLTLSGTADFDY